MKKAAILVLALSTSTVSLPRQEESFMQIPSKVLHMLDGIPYAIDAVTVHDIIGIRRKINELLYGKLNKSTMAHEGHYAFKGQSYTLEELATLESDATRRGHTETNSELRRVLEEQIKPEFVKISEPFIKQTQGMKHLIVKLIDDWSVMRSRSDSLLREWANEDGSEHQQYNNSIRSINDQFTFCKDLSVFLGDMVYSCPKAREQYKEWRNKAMKQQNKK